MGLVTERAEKAPRHFLSRKVRQETFIDLVRLSELRELLPALQLVDKICERRVPIASQVRIVSIINAG